VVIDVAGKIIPFCISKLVIFESVELCVEHGKKASCS